MKRSKRILNLLENIYADVATLRHNEALRAEAERLKAQLATKEALNGKQD